MFFKQLLMEECCVCARTHACGVFSLPRLDHPLSGALQNPEQQPEEERAVIDGPGLPC
jgi:hypothetical protein